MKKKISSYRKTTAIGTAIFALLAIFFFLLTVSRGLYPRRYRAEITEWCSVYDVPEAIVFALIRTESGFREDACSPVGAYGLTQLMPDTFYYIAVELLHLEKPDIRSVAVQIRCGIYYLRLLYDRYGIWNTAFAAYNAGPARVDSWLRDPAFSRDGVSLIEIPFEETKTYVARMTRSWKIYLLLQNISI